MTSKRTILFATVLAAILFSFAHMSVASAEINKSDANWSDAGPGSSTTEATTGQAIDCPTGKCAKYNAPGSFVDDPPREPPANASNVPVVPVKGTQQVQ